MSKKLSKEKQESVHQTNERIFNLLFVEDELSWKDIIYKLIEEEHMDPWDIDVSILANKFLELLKKLKELDFRISGKMVLASAILLKMKSDILIEEDIPHFDQIMNPTEENMVLEDQHVAMADATGSVNIFPRTPQPRKRKVSIFDLVKALEKALEVESKRKHRNLAAKKIEIRIPEKKYDLGKSMQSVYGKVTGHYKKKKTQILTFDDLVPSDAKQDKVLTFVPLLHLDTQRKIDLEQENHFNTIAVKLPKTSEKEKSSSE
jgi:segregation and condensation protein A